MLNYLTVLVYPKTVIHLSVGGYLPRRFAGSVNNHH